MIFLQSFLKNFNNMGSKYRNFDNTELAFKLTFITNVMKVIKIISELYQRCFGKNLAKTQNKEEILIIKKL